MNDNVLCHSQISVGKPRGIGRLPEMPQFSRTGFYAARIPIQWIGVIPQVDINAL